MKALAIFLGFGMCSAWLTSIQTNPLTKPAPNRVLESSIGNQNFAGLTITDALVRSLTMASVPGGIVINQDCNEPARPSFERSATTLRSALDQIVSADRSHRWIFRKGTVNLLSAKQSPSLLDLQIAKFEVENVPTARDAVNQLVAMSEVQRRAHELGLSSGYIRLGINNLNPAGAGQNNYSRKLAIRVRGVTLLEALNEIVRVNGGGVWAYTERHCRGRNEFSVDILSQ
jgi:hypothetical protein